MDDIFDLQEQLSRKIVEALKVALTPQEEKRLASRPIDDFRAYDAWLRARRQAWTLTKEGLERATLVVEQAQETLGENALLHAALARILISSYEIGICRDSDTLRRGGEHADRALELAPDLPTAMGAKAQFHFKRGEFEDVVRWLRRAVDHGGDTEVLFFLGVLLAFVGKLDEARKFAVEAFARDPLDWFTHFVRVLVEFLDGDFDAATSRCRQSLETLGSDEPLIVWWLAQSLAHAGELDEARVVFAKVAATEAVPFAELSELYCRAADGDRHGVLQLLEESTILAEVAKTDEWFPNVIATCLAMVGDEDRAIDWMNRAVDWGFANYRYYSEYSPFHKPLHGNPRFQELVVKARMKHEAFDA